MNYEEQIRARFETVADRLRDGVVREFEEHVRHLSEVIEAERLRGREDGLREGLAQGREEGLHLGRAQGRELAREQALGEWQAAMNAAAARLINAVHALDSARSLTEILNTLVDSSAHEASRVALLLVDGGSVRPWRSIGFDPPIAAAETSQEALGMVADVISGNRTSSTIEQRGTPPPAFARAPAGATLVAIPLPLDGRPAAILYAECELSDGRVSGTTRWSLAALEVLACHAAQELASVTALRAAQIVAHGLRFDGANPERAAVADIEPVEEAARRYARLLISEIKLYHEAEVAAGRLEGNLRARLEGEIARARTLYRERIPDRLDRESRVFESELVRTLADGNEALLGSTT